MFPGSFHYETVTSLIPKPYDPKGKYLAMQTHFDSWVLEQEVQLHVDKAILGGKFMGSATDGKVAWLKSSLPLAVGDSVTARVSKIAKRGYELEVLSIDQKSITRMEPFCPHTTMWRLSLASDLQ